MSLADVTDPRFTDDQRAVVARFDAAETPPEVVEARVVEEVARAMCTVADFTTWDLLHPADVEHYRRLATAAVAAYRSAQDGGAEEADANGCPERQHHGVDCPGDACRFAAALAPQAGECTGESAQWCPNHGTCTGTRDTDQWDSGRHDPDDPADADGCPLHDSSATHASQAGEAGQ